MSDSCPPAKARPKVTGNLVQTQIGCYGWSRATVFIDELFAFTSKRCSALPHFAHLSPSTRHKPSSLSRPEEITQGSQWHALRDNNGISGHAFMGSLPFITAAKMTQSPASKALWYAGSTIAPLSRVNDGAHYSSQVALGWWLAFWLPVPWMLPRIQNQDGTSCPTKAWTRLAWRLSIASECLKKCFLAKSRNLCVLIKF